MSHTLVCLTAGTCIPLTEKSSLTFWASQSGNRTGACNDVILGGFKNFSSLNNAIQKN